MSTLFQRLILPLSVAAYLLHAVPVHAQGAAQTAADNRVDPRKTARLHLGGIHLTPAIEVRNIGIDSNVFNDLANPQSDFSATITPSTKVWIPATRRGLLTSNLSVGFVYFKKFTSERSVDPGASIRGDVYFRRLTLFGEVGTQRSRERPSEEIDARSRRTEHHARVGFLFQVNGRLSAEVAQVRDTVAYDQDAQFFGVNLQRALGRAEQGVQVTVRNVLTKRTTFYLRADQLQSRFDLSHERDTDGFRIVPGFQFSPRALLNGRFEVGLRHLSSRSGLLPAYTGLVAGTSLTYTLAGETQFGVDWQRDLGFSFEAATPYYVTNGTGATIRRQVVGNVDVIVAARYSTSTYRSLTAVVQPIDPRRDINRSYSLNIGYRLNRDARIGLGLTQTSRTTSASGRNYDNFRMGVTVTYGG